MEKEMSFEEIMKKNKKNKEKQKKEREKHNKKVTASYGLLRNRRDK